MQTSNYSLHEYPENRRKMDEDFTNKLKINASHHKSQDPERKLQSFDEKPQSFIHNSRPGSESQEPDPKIQSLNQVDDHGEDYEGEGEGEGEGGGEFEFTFASSNDFSPISADKIFQNGQIRPVYPLFDRSLLDASQPETGTLRPPLKKVFVDKQVRDHDAPCSPDELEGVPEETYCLWNGRTVEDASPDSCKKSNSTGFSKLRMFRDMRRRSSSDGKDAFVFLNDKNHEEKAKTKKKTESNDAIKDEKKEEEEDEDEEGLISMKPTSNVKGKTMSSAHEKHYLKNRAMKEGGRHKSYLPYRQDLLGFFTNVNVLSKNVHPY